MSRVGTVPRLVSLSADATSTSSFMASYRKSRRGRGSYNGRKCLPLLIFADSTADIGYQLLSVASNLIIVIRPRLGSGHEGVVFHRDFTSSVPPSQGYPLGRFFSAEIGHNINCNSISNVTHFLWG